MNIFITTIMNNYGYFGILFLIAIENIFPPIPSEVILTLGGFLTTQNDCSLNIIGVIIFSTLGSLIGAIILYYFGYLLNRDRLENIFNSKIGKILCLKNKDLDRSDNLFSKSGNLTVLYCRFIPIVRSLISIPAGMNKMNITIFLLYTTLGSLVWNTVLVSLGSLVGENYMIVANIFNKYSKLILIFFIIVGLYLIIKKIYKKYNKS